MKNIIYIILFFISIICYSQNDITIVGDIAGNPVLSDVDANDTTRWGTGAGNPVLSGVDANDTTRWATDNYNTVLSGVTANDTTRWASSASTDSIFDYLSGTDSIHAGAIVVDSLGFMADTVFPFFVKRGSTTSIMQFGTLEETSASSLDYSGVGGMVTGNTETGIAVTYQSADSTFDFVVDAILTGISANDTTQWGLKAREDSTWEKITITDSLVVEDIRITGWSLTDTFVLIVDVNGVVDTAGLVPAADIILNKNYNLDDFDSEYELVMQHESLQLPIISKEGNIQNKYQLKKPYLACDMQLLAEIEKLYRRLYELQKRIEKLENEK